MFAWLVITDAAMLNIMHIVIDLLAIYDYVCMILNNDIYLFVIHGTFGGHCGGLGVARWGSAKKLIKIIMPCYHV